MNERHAYKIPQLNKWGVIDSTVLEIEIPSTIDASFLNIIKSNLHASYLYNNIKYHLEKIDDTKKRVTLFGNSLELWSDKKELSSSSSPVFVFELPSAYSSKDYTYKVEYKSVDYNFWVTHRDNTIKPDGNMLTITVNHETTTTLTYRVTVNAKKAYSVIGEVLILDFVDSTPVISSQKTALQGGQNNNIIITDGSLSDTSINPVQNKVITNALKNKSDVNTGYQFHENEILISKNDGDCVITGSGKALDDFASADHTHDYNDLTDKPTIPTKTSDLTNDSGFITADDVGNLNNIALSYASTMEILTSTVMPIGTIVDNNNATFPEGITVNNHNINL